MLALLKNHTNKQIIPSVGVESAIADMVAWNTIEFLRAKTALGPAETVGSVHHMKYGKPPPIFPLLQRFLVSLLICGRFAEALVLVEARLRQSFHIWKRES